ncbi:dual OB domain-containing protein [Pseudolysinimonas sp.]
MREEILLLANSRKPGGRCLAGVRSDGTWVRPVASAEGAAIPVEYSVVSGRALQPLDIVEFEVSAHVPRAHQAEDYLLAGPIRLVRSATASEVEPFLDSIAQNVPSFVQSTSESVFADELEDHGTPMDSLALMRTDRVTLDATQGNTPRARFTRDGQLWSIRYTDDLRYPVAANGELVLGAGFVCVSLAEEFSPYGTAAPRHYKLAAGLILE